MDAVIEQTEIRHIYLVGGSLTDARKEGERFLQLARFVKQANTRGIPVTLGSGAMPDDQIEQFHARAAWSSTCASTSRCGPSRCSRRSAPARTATSATPAGSRRWRRRCAIWGRGNVYSAMVAGIELEPEHGLEWQDAARTALEGAEDLCRRGIVPIYSLVWPVGGRQRPDYHARIRSYFETLTAGYAEIRRRHGLAVADSFMCHRCAYMQLECDVDRLAAAVAA